VGVARIGGTPMTRMIALMVLFSAALVGALMKQDVASTAGQFPVLEGPYLGQKRPGQVLQVFQLEQIGMLRRCRVR